MPWHVEVTLRTGNTQLTSPSFASREEAEAELEELKGAIYQGGGINRPWIALASGQEILVAHVTGEETVRDRMG